MTQPLSLFILVFSLVASEGFCCEVGSVNSKVGYSIKVTTPSTSCDGWTLGVDEALAFDINVASLKGDWRLEKLILKNQDDHILAPIEARMRLLSKDQVFADNIVFPQGGNWQLTLQMSSAGKKEDAVIQLRVAGGEHRKKAEQHIGGKVPEFSLTDPKGVIFTPDKLQGDVWVVNFFFATCPMICPLMTKKMANLQTHFAGLKEFHSVSITTDPKNDTAEALQRFGKTYGANPDRWHFLRGDTAVVRALSAKGFDFGGDPELPSHSTSFVLIDKKGTVRGLYDSRKSEEIDQIKAAIKKLAAE